MNIHNIVNANSLMSKCMSAVNGREGSDMVLAYKTKIAFDKYMGDNTEELKYADGVTKFVHRGKEEGRENTYMDKKVGGTEHFSAYDVLENVLEGNSETGDCVGTSQVCAYLLASKGVKVGALKSINHVLIKAHLYGKWFPIETTTEEGFNYPHEETFKEKSISKLEETVMHSNAASFRERGNYDAAIESFNELIKRDKKDINSYLSRGITFSIKGEYGLANNDYAKIIELDENLPEAYFNRGLSELKENNFTAAITDLEKYASFSKENADEVSTNIENLKRCESYKRQKETIAA